jgi:tetratricopeptide (TPR) repeat protein
VTRRQPSHGYSLRDLQSLLGVSRRVLSGLVAAGFVSPSRGHRNELRFSFRDVVLLRTACQLQSARIPTRSILQALQRLKSDMPEEASLTGLRISAVGNAVAVRAGPTQWDANSGQLLLDFGEPEARCGVTVMGAALATRKSREQQAASWYARAEHLHATDPAGAEWAYRKAIELSPEPHYHALNNLGSLLSEKDSRCADALRVYDEALKHFADADLLHYNRGVVLEHLGRLEDAAESYLQCLQRDAHNDEALFSRGTVLEKLGRLDEAADAYVKTLGINPHHSEARHHLKQLIGKLADDTRVIRHLSALRRSTV